MNDFVNRLQQLQKLTAAAGIEVQMEAERLCFSSPLGSACLRLVRLYRPSSRDIERSSAPDVLLVVTAPTGKALAAAAHTNYLVLPEGACRIVTSGIVLALDAPAAPAKASHQVRLTGRTGTIAETLLLGGLRDWSIRDLAQASQVSSTLAHRVVSRLEREGLLLAKGSATAKVRAICNFRALAELWQHEEKEPQRIMRGFLYGSSLESVAQQIMAIYPEGAVGGTLAANLYKPTLTRVPPPLRIWVKTGFDPESLFAVGLERTEEGANIEFVAGKEDAWRAHRNQESLPIVSRARAWLEVSGMGGRAHELAEALFLTLEQQQ